MLRLAKNKIYSFANSKWPFYITILVFAIEAGWLAITSNYPMAFDESYHFLLIQFFSHHLLNPVVLHQPASTYQLGNIVHNPSFLYHYLMSFPYWLISHITSSVQAQVITLRFINLGFGIGSLFYGFKILRQLKVPAAVANIILLVYALTPLVTVLAAQINYDNLLLLVSAITIYQSLKLVEEVKKNKINMARLGTILCLCLFGSLVKFSFLPIFAGTMLLLAWSLGDKWHKDSKAFKKKLFTSFNSLTLPVKVVLISLFSLGAGLFVTYYGYNVIKYHNPLPQCNQILSTNDCRQYYAWNRNYVVEQYSKTHPVAHKMSLFSYTVFWFKVEYYQLFGEIIPTGGLVYIARSFYVIVVSLSVIGAVSAIIMLKQIFQRYKALFLIAPIAAVYLLALWLRNYHDYLNLGQPLAIQGRYLVPVLIYVYAFFAVGIMLALESKKLLKNVLRPMLVLVVIFSFIYFGGYVRYASNISPTYKWPSPASVSQSSHKRLLARRHESANV